jgi:hypothetical protein
MTANRQATGAGPRRGGYTLVEVVLSVVVLLSAMTVVVKVLGWVGVEQRVADRRSWAVQEVANLMERLTAEPFEDITRARARSLSGERTANRVLPGAEWEADVGDETAGPVPAKRVTLRLRWKARSGGWEGPVRLTSWVYRRRPRP